MQNIASVAKLAIQILSVLLLATIMGNKNRNNNNSNNNNNRNQYNNNYSNGNSNNNNNYNSYNIYIIAMALPITTNDDDISYKDNTDILIFSDSSSSSINLSDGSFGIENSEINIENGDIINDNGGINDHDNDGISNSNLNIDQNNNKNNNNNNNDNSRKKKKKDNKISDKNDFIIEITTIGYNLNDNIENYSTIDSNKNLHKNNNNNNNDDNDDDEDDDIGIVNDDDTIDNDEQNIIFKTENTRIDDSQIVNVKDIDISTRITSAEFKTGTENVSISSKLSNDRINMNSNNNNNSNIILSKTSSTLTKLPNNRATIDNTGILKGPSLILDRFNSTKINSTLSSSSTSLSLSSIVSISTDDDNLKSSSSSSSSTSFLSSSSSSSSSSPPLLSSSSSSFLLSPSSQSESSLSSTNLLLLQKNSYVPAIQKQLQQQQNIPIQDNLIALNATATNGRIGTTNDTTIIKTGTKIKSTTVKTYLGMQNNITTTTTTSNGNRLLSSSLTSVNNDNKKLSNNFDDDNDNNNNDDDDDNIIMSNNKNIGSSNSGNSNGSRNINSSTTSNSNSNNNNNRGISNGSSHSNSHNGHSGVVSSFSEAISSKLTLPKPQKTDAPMLNYIFDTYSAANKHHHHDQRYGPHFEDKREGNITNITVQAGSTIHLNCRISLLQDKTVSWVKRNHNGDEEALELLTVGAHTYTGDSRFTIDFQYPSNWRLKISNVRKTDEGQYECQISTHPPRVIQISLHVNAPKVMIVDEYGIPLQEKYYEIDSTLQLSCIVRNVVMSTSAVFWSHGEQILNYDLIRGGVSVKTELMDDGANSTLFIAKINKSDSGNYTCSINPFHDYSIMVHILNGESFAELHHGNSSRLTSTIGILLYIVLIIQFIIQFHQRNKIYLVLR